MKQNTTLFTLLFAISVILGGMGCATSSIRMQVLVPAHINVDRDIQEIALVNRYRPGKGQGALNILEGAISGENIGQDRRSAEAALGGLTEALAGSPRFRIKRPPVELKGTGRAVFPEPLRVSKVQEICNQSGSHALVTIEAFDSDTRVSCKAETREKKKDGETIKYTVFEARKGIDVTVGWRMYDGKTGNLIDEYRMFRTVWFEAEGPTEAAAISNLPNGDPVTQRIGRVTGNLYSQRISPTWIWVSRRYYVKGSDELKVAKRSVKVNDWDSAQEWWDKALDNPKEKVRARAFYNLALAAELYGELEEALNLAKESGKAGNKKAYDYSSVIRRRIRDQERLDQQMEGAPK